MSDREGKSPAAAFQENTTGSNVELAYAGIDTFLKSPQRAIEEVGEEDAAVLGAPYDGAVSNRPGARYGPRAIRQASGWWAYLSGYKGGLTNMRTGSQVDYSSVALADCGDVPVFPMDYATTAESIRAHVETIATQGTMPVLLGGDHYCTFPAFEGFAAGSEAESVGLVQIDAHSDATAESSVFGTDFHGSSTHHIATSPYGEYDHVSQVGIRGYEAPEFFEFADSVGLHCYTMGDVRERGIDRVVEGAIEAAAAETDAVYVTFDIDGVDPSVAPGTGTPCPGGLSAEEALTVMELLGTWDAVGAVDLMEVAPTYDPTEGTQRLGSYLLSTFLERQFAE
jgi:agmatinase